MSAQHKRSIKDLAVSTEIGLLNGKSQVNVQMLASAGIQKKKYYVGLGSGFDYYGYRTIPVFIEGKRFFGIGNRRLFTYGRAGMNLPWVLSTQQRQYYTFSGMKNSTYNNGAYFDAGIGYTFYNAHQRGLFTRLGFCHQTLSEDYKMFMWNGTTSSLTDHHSKYIFNNVQLSIGYKF